MGPVPDYHTRVADKPGSWTRPPNTAILIAGALRTLAEQVMLAMFALNLRAESCGRAVPAA